MLVLGSFTMLQNLVQEYFPVGLGALWRSLAPCKRIALGKAPYETVALKRANLAPYKRTALGMAPCQTVAVGMTPYKRSALGMAPCQTVAVGMAPCQIVAETPSQPNSGNDP